MSRKSFSEIIRRRIKIVLLFFFLIYLLLAGRLFLVQIILHDEYKTAAERQHSVKQEVLAERGAIYATDKDGLLVPLALNRTERVLVVSPRDVKDREAAVLVLEKSLGLGREEVVSKLSKANDTYEIVQRHLDPEVSEKLMQRLPAGFFLEDEVRRVYPHDMLAAHILGFVGSDENKAVGQYGVERNNQEDLAGEKGFFQGAKDAAGFLVMLGKRIIHPPDNGANVVLTIDYNIQQKAEGVLRYLSEKWKAASGSILVFEPKTGRILAISALPTYNPNEYSKEKNFGVFLNPVFEHIYEFGSVFKPITMAAGIEEGVVEPDTTYVDPGEVRIFGYKIQNFDQKSHGTQTMTQVLEKSLNTGAVHVAKLLGKERQLAYIKKFGFGEKIGIDLPGEVSGNISNLLHMRDIDFATASFGQGIAVTPLQMAMAIGAIANGGELVKPFVVDRVVDDAGVTFRNGAEVRRRVVSKETSEKITKMLVSAVKTGFENRAGVKGYFVAGKTGTAQIPRKDGRGYSDMVIHTFIGYAPAFDPRFLVMIQLNEPIGNRFASNTITPGFHDLAEYILNYYEVPPDEK